MPASTVAACFGICSLQAQAKASLDADLKLQARVAKSANSMNLLSTVSVQGDKGKGDKKAGDGFTAYDLEVDDVHYQMMMWNSFASAWDEIVDVSGGVLLYCSCTAPALPCTGCTCIACAACAADNCTAHPSFGTLLCSCCDSHAHRISSGPLLISSAHPHILGTTEHMPDLMNIMHIP